MNIGHIRFARIWVVLCLGILFSGACIFSPKKDDPGIDTPGKVEIPTTPEKVVNNLKLAFSDQNIEYYRNCLHDNYFYLCKSEVDTLDIRWNKSEDVQIVENVMKGSKKFIFTAFQNTQIEEYGDKCLNIPDGATISYDHPNEMWLVINYTVDMEIFTKSYGDINVHQFMEFKFVKDPKTNLYSIIQWNDLTNQ